MQITVVLHNIRSTYNVGAILRTSEGLGIEKVIYSGYTPRYDDPNLLPHLREKLNRQIAKSALGTEKLVEQVLLDNSTPDTSASLLTNWLKCAIMEGYRAVGLENNLSEAEMERQIILGEKNDANGRPIDFGDKVVLVLGEEVEGIPAELREKMDYFLEIPMKGQKESFNVSVATGIALWGLQNYH